MKAALLVLLAAAAHAAPAGFGDSSMGKKPYGVLLIAGEAGGAWRRELPNLRAQLPGVAVESADTMTDARTLQKALDKLKSQHVEKVVAIPLELVSESPAMDQLRWLFGIRAEAVDDRPDAVNPTAAPAIKPKTQSSIVLAPKGAKRLKFDGELVLTATIDKSAALAEILAERATAQSRHPAKEAVVLVARAPRSDKALEAWKTAVGAIAESVRLKGGFREAAVLYVRDGVRAPQQDKDRADNKATLRGLTTQGGVVAVPLAADGKFVGQLLQKQLGAGGYRWNGKGVLGDARFSDWVGAISKAASTLPDARQYKD